MEKQIWRILAFWGLFMLMGTWVWSQDSIRGVKIQGTFHIATAANTSETYNEEAPPPKPAPSSPNESPDLKFDLAPKPLNLDSVFSWLNFPPAAEEAQLEGKVVTEILVSEKGQYLEHRIKTSDHPLFTAEVEKQIKRLRFRPAKLNQTPVKGWAKITFPFRLHR